MAGAAEFLYAPELREAFGDVAHAVRHGGTRLAAAGTVTPDHPVWVRFARAMAPLMRMPARAVVDLVEVDATAPLRVLDVAAGHGVFGLAFAQAYPRAEVTALDWPAVLAVARENARAAGVDGRFHTLAGSAFETPLGRAVRPRAGAELPAPLRSGHLRGIPGHGRAGPSRRAGGW